MAPGSLPVKGRTLCRNMASGIRHCQALQPPSKCLHRSELYLLCKAGTVMAPPRRAVGGLRAIELIKAVPVHSHPRERSAVTPLPRMAHSLPVFHARPRSGRDHVFLIFVPSIPDLMSLNGDSLESCGHSQGQTTPRRCSCRAPRGTLHSSWPQRHICPFAGTWVALSDPSGSWSSGEPSTLGEGVAAGVANAQKGTLSL